MYILFLTADSSIPVEEQIYQMRTQLETLEQVPDIIRETFENVAEKLYQKNQVRLLFKNIFVLTPSSGWNKYS